MTDFISSNARGAVALIAVLWTTLQGLGTYHLSNMDKAQARTHQLAVENNKALETFIARQGAFNKALEDKVVIAGHDRFTATQARREYDRIDAEVDALEERVSALSTRVTTLEAKL